MDIIDGYQLTIGKAQLFGPIDSFINVIGLPHKVTVAKTEFKIKTIKDVKNAIKTETGNAVTSLNYNGFDMWYIHGDLVPFTIDLRQTHLKIKYKNTFIFDTTYSLADFQQLFPKAAKNQIPSEMSLFKMLSHEEGHNYKSFMLRRISKSDKNATPTVEFTFKGDQLIFLCFMNVD